MRISDWSSDVCSSDLSGLAAAGGAAADRCRRLPLFGGRQRLLPFLTLRLLPAVLTLAVEIGLELLLALPAVLVIVEVHHPDMPVEPDEIMAVLDLTVACFVVPLSKTQGRDRDRLGTSGTVSFVL